MICLGSHEATLPSSAGLSPHPRRPACIPAQRSCQAARYTKPNDAIEWIWDLVPNEDKKNYGYQGIAQLAIAAVSVRTTSKLLTNIVLNLIAYPEYVPILKEEIENVLASCDGQWTLDSMSKLEKLDSFMKESLRFDTPLTGHPPYVSTQGRAAHHPQRWHSSATRDFSPSTLQRDRLRPEYLPNPEQFDELRFYKLRHQNDSKANNIIYRFTAASKTQQAILFKYDLKFRTGEERPKTWLFQTINTPDPKGKILVRTAQHV
ncbi:hypothetical protein KXV47_002739 [Aspergillus fumigatus]|nr:hypothetical protein KXV47_002739 [Aspergillus fumigatus]